MSNDRWGILYCPSERNWHTRRHRRKIEAYLTSKGQAYELVQSENRGHVEQLAALLTARGFRTLIVVGGDAALNEALNGVVAATPPGQEYPTLGIIPDGLINDFARYWGFPTSSPEEVIDILLRQRTLKVDLGRATLTGINGEETVRYFLNCVNVGLAASIIKLRRRSHSFWRGFRLLSNLTNIFLLLLHRHSSHMSFDVNGEHHSRRITTLCIGSSTGFGQTPSAVPYNGMLDVSAVRRPHLLQAFSALMLLFRRRFLSQKGIRVWRTKEIEISRLGQVTVSIDGQAAQRRITRLKAEVLPQTLRFIIV